MPKRDVEDASRVAGTLATVAGQRILEAGGNALVLTLPGGGTYVAKALRGPGGSKVAELRRDGVLIDSRVLANDKRRVLDARRAFLAEFEDLVRLMPELIKLAHDRRRVELLGRRAHGQRTDQDAMRKALDVARRHGIDASK